GIALANENPRVGEQELRLVTRVAVDSLPILRRNVLLALLDAWPAAPLPLADLAKRLRMPSRTIVRRCLEDLHALGTIIRCETNPGLAEQWKLDGRWAKVLAKIAEAIPAERRILTPADSPETEEMA